MSRLHLWVLLLCGWGTTSGWAVGERYAELRVGDQVYVEAQVLSANAASLSIRHARGISQVPLAALSHELQARYGYSPQGEAERERELERERTEQRVAEERRLEALRRDAAKPQGPRSSAALSRAFASFGQAPTLETEVDLRGLFRERGIAVRNQGLRPSCAIHSVVSALEFQFAERSGQSLNLSEIYLLRTVCQTLDRPFRSFNESVPSARDGIVVDEGFSLEQVFQAIRGHGLALDGPDMGTRPLDTVERVDGASFSAFIVPGGQSASGLGNLVHVLNARVPVVVGLAWPSDAQVRSTSLVSKQVPAPGAGHAVTLVGYRCETGRLEDTVFIFRNSWGPRWGAGGYGFVTYEYLSKHLFSSYVVELN